MTGSHEDAAGEPPRSPRAPVGVGTLERIRQQLDAALAVTAAGPNDERLWVRVRAEAEALLYGCWRNGELAGTTPAQAFFVRCDRSTMTQNDLDNGRLNLLVGLAIAGPAEFTTLEISRLVRGATHARRRSPGVPPPKT